MCCRVTKRNEIKRAKKTNALALQAPESTETPDENEKGKKRSEELSHKRNFQCTQFSWSLVFVVIVTHTRSERDTHNAATERECSEYNSLGVKIEIEVEE